MKALVFYDVGDIRLEEVSKPKIQNPFDAIVRITLSAICGTDLHFVRGTINPLKKGTILGHEAVGMVESVGKGVRNLKEGQRVIVPSTIACGYCRMCRKSQYSQCDESNPNGPEAGTAYFGGPKDSGPFNGCQAEYVRVPFAHHNLIQIPENVPDNKAILLSDIFPTGYFAADLAKVKPGDVVVVQGCGPVGQFVIASCKLMGASRIIAIDAIASRLDLAIEQGAECINFNEEDPLEVVKEMTKGTLADVVIDAVGLDAYRPDQGPAEKRVKKLKKEFEKEVSKLAPSTNTDGKNWRPGDAPSLVLRDSVDLVGKGGVISIVGVYSQNCESFPIGKAMNKNIKMVMGNCPHRAYIPTLLQKVQAGLIDPTKILTQTEHLTNVLDAYRHFDTRESGWIKVALKTT